MTFRLGTTSCSSGEACKRPGESFCSAEASLILRPGVHERPFGPPAVHGCTKITRCTRLHTAVHVSGCTRRRFTVSDMHDPEEECGTEAERPDAARDLLCCRQLFPTSRGCTDCVTARLSPGAPMRGGERGRRSSAVRVGDDVAPIGYTDRRDCSCWSVERRQLAGGAGGRRDGSWRGG